MSTDPDQIREDIRRTRSELSSDVDALTGRANPANVAHRQVDKVRSTASTLPDAARSQARGNPLAAGLVAFGLGWLASSLVPSSRQEQRLAQSAKEQASPLVQEAKDVAQEVAQNLRQPAQAAATAVKDRAAEAGTTLREEGRSTTEALRSDAPASADPARGSTASPYGENGY